MAEEHVIRILRNPRTLEPLGGVPAEAERAFNPFRSLVTVGTRHAHLIAPFTFHREALDTGGSSHLT